MLGMLVALLGVLKAGAAYVPLDPAYPIDRLAFMLEDARAGVLVTERDVAADLPLSTASIVTWIEEHGRLEAESTGDPVARARPGDWPT